MPGAPPRPATTRDVHDVTAPAGLLLSPGAGGSRDHPTLLALDEAATRAGFAVCRHDFRADGQRRPPPRIDVAAERLRDEADRFAQRIGASTSELVVGGRSFGGRALSLAVANGLSVAGLLLLSYPLHPPGKPLAMRTAHFGDIAAPCLFVSAANDPFIGSAEQLTAASQLINAPVRLEVLGRGGHDPASVAARKVICDVTLDWMSSLRA